MPDAPVQQQQDEHEDDYVDRVLDEGGPPIGDESDEGAGGGGQADDAKPDTKVEEPKTDPSLEDLRTKLSRLDQELLELRTRNTALEGAVLERRDQRPEVRAEPVEDDDPLAGLVEADLIDGLKKSPVRTIKEIAERVASHTAKKTRQEVLAEVQSAGTVRDAWTEDRAATLGEFPDLQSNKDLQQAAEAEYALLARQHGGHNLPGDMYSSVSRAAAKLARAGKYNFGNGTKQNGGGKGLRELVTNRGNQPGLETDRANPTGPAPKVRYSEREMAAIRKTCKEMGISVEKWMERAERQAKARSQNG